MLMSLLMNLTIKIIIMLVTMVQIFRVDKKQRLAIARAVYSNSPILILDEATSSLDSKSEKLVQDAIDKLMINKTSIVIAHRLSTIQNANKIIVLDKGEIVEQGNHDQLIKNDSYYKKLIALQSFK